jgi:GT2 family glycosyltransferase/glycosyltransferase involved in cell wall biosynthesis
MLFRLRSLILILITGLFLPFLLAVWLVLLFFNLIHMAIRFTRERLPIESPPVSGLASIVVLNWNGADLLEQGLPSIIKAVQTDGHPHEILVVDNGSTDGSLEYLKKFYPGVRVLPLEKNYGFSEGNNAGVQAAVNDVVILLNNDMVVDPGFIAPLLKGFGPNTFAVSSQIFHQDPSQRREETGKTTGVFRRGMIDFSHRKIESSPLPRTHYPVLWAGGGSSAFHRDKFLALGGFQKLYSPAYVEDTDLSYQAWRVGWEVLMAPESIVYHKHRASANRRFNPSELQALISRNQFLFIWKNIESWRLLLLHGFFLPWNCYRLTRDHGPIAWLGLLRAACVIPFVGAAKLGFRFQAVRTDSQILELFSKPGLYFCLQRRNKAPHGSKPHLLWLTAYLPHTGRHAGAGRMFQLLKRLSANFQITLITFLETDAERELLAEVEPFCEKVIAMRRFCPARWQIFPYEPFDEFLTPEMEQAVDRCLESRDFDLIQLEYTQMACYAKRAAGIPTLVTKHEVDFAACARRARREVNPIHKLRWFYNYLQVLDREIRLTQNVNAVICMTDSDARELKKFCPSTAAYVINTGVDLDYFKPPDQPEIEPRLIFVGAFQHLPNVEAMEYFCREVLPIVQEKIAGIELLIVGSNPPPTISRLSEIPNVHVTGFVPDIRPFMARSSIYVVPLRLGVGIRGKILEAWSMKMAVVSTSVGCAGLRYENNRNLVIADTPQQFAKQIVSLVKDPLRRQNLGEEGRRTAEQYYGWEKTVQQLEALYRFYLNYGIAHEHSTSLSHTVFAAESKTPTSSTRSR